MVEGWIDPGRQLLWLCPQHQVEAGAQAIEVACLVLSSKTRDFSPHVNEEKTFVLEASKYSTVLFFLMRRSEDRKEEQIQILCIYLNVLKILLQDITYLPAQGELLLLVSERNWLASMGIYKVLKIVAGTMFDLTRSKSESYASCLYDLCQTQT